MDVTWNGAIFVRKVGYYNLKVHGCLHFEPQGAMPSLDFQYKGKSILRSCIGSPISL